MNNVVDWHVTMDDDVDNDDDVDYFRGKVFDLELSVPFHSDDR